MAAVTIIAGPVGSGKTAVAQALEKLWPGPLISIEGDKFWSFFAKGASEDFRENFGLIMRSMTVSAVPFWKTGYDVILDFSVPPGFVQHAHTILKEAPLHYVVLRPSLTVCAKRAAARGEGKIDNYEPYSRLYSLFDDAPAKSVISNENGNAEQTAKLVFDGLAAGKFRAA